MQLAAYSHQCEIVHINSFVYDFSGWTVSQWKAVTVTGTQLHLLHLAADMQHGVVRALTCCLILRLRIKKF